MEPPAPSEAGPSATSYPELELELVDSVEPSTEAPPLLRERGLSVIILPHEVAGPDGQLRLVARFRIEDEKSSKVRELTQSTEITICPELVPRLDVIWSTEEVMVIDAQLICSYGSALRHQQIAHTVVVVSVSSAMEDFGEAHILHVGSSEVVDDDGLAFESDRLQYYVEAGELAVYRQSVAWCDRAAMKEARGRADCRQKIRTLRQVARVRIL